MKLENLRRAAIIVNEIANVSKQIEKAKRMRDAKNGFVIAEHKDFSGMGIDYVYEDGNFPSQLYENIINFVIIELENHLSKLKDEVKML